LGISLLKKLNNLLVSYHLAPFCPSNLDTVNFGLVKPRKKHNQKLNKCRLWLVTCFFSFSIANIIVSTPSSVSSKVGAKPPSSTAVDKIYCKIDFKLWKTCSNVKLCEKDEVTYWYNHKFLESN
jgi:hypothetical protein